MLCVIIFFTDRIYALIIIEMKTAQQILRAGKLFLWQGKDAPKHVPLPEDIVKTSVGPQHVAILGGSGNIYTFGNNSDGKLGHGDHKDKKVPTKVEYFEKHDIKIKDVVCGERHTVALSEKGEVYTFGFGKKQHNFLTKLFINDVGPTGHGVDIPKTITKPTKVKALEGKHIHRITAGRHFSLAITQQGEVYNWGNGQYGAFGDGENKNTDLPLFNSFFRYLAQEENLKPVKVKSCESFSIALMNNQQLYGFGSNEHGQMGIKSEVGVEMYETVNFITEVIREGYEGHQVVNFDISENCLIFQLDNGELWWSGMKINYKPIKFEIGDVKPKLFAASSRALAVVDHENMIYSKNNFLNLKNEDMESIKTGIQKEDASLIFKGEVIGLGGEYSKRYAIIA